MNIREIAVMLAIIAILISAAICLRNTDDNEIKSDRHTKDDNIEREPGFEAVFTILALLAVACFFSRRRKNKEKDEDKDNKRGHG